MDNMDNPKKPQKYSCKLCDFNTLNLKDYKRHCLTQKHLQSAMDNKNPKKTPKNPKGELVCFYCKKVYKYRSGLSKHIKKCVENADDDGLIDNKKIILNKDVKDKDAMLLDMFDQNKELHKIIIDQNKQISELIPKVGNTTNNFNLNVFLNEECKDAIDWTSFINSIELELSSLKELENSDITKSITDAVCNKIHELGVYKRPIHCVDKKRKKLCIKNEEEWEQDDNKVNNLLLKGDKELQHKYVVLIKEWEEAHPDWLNDESLVEEYMNMSSKIYQNVDDIKYKVELLKEVAIPKIN